MCFSENWDESVDTKIPMGSYRHYVSVATFMPLNNKGQIATQIQKQEFISVVFKGNEITCPR